MKNIIRVLPFIALLCSLQSFAFSVDKMFIVSDKKGNGIITLKNDETNPIFVEAQVQELDVNDGVYLVKTPYDINNIEDWKISLTHQKLVLKPGEEKAVGVRSLCYNTTCDGSRDLMFMLPFAPSKYNPEGEEVSGIEINYGFSPVYIIPTTNPIYSYEIFNNGETLTVKNDSNTMLSVFVNNCDEKITSNCRQKFTLIAGREKTFNLPPQLQSEQLNITVTSHDKSYSQKESVKRGNN
ncbi:hypothetical protein [Vibrio genomosp. F10]|uniref:hypothetical protein n=1 Tax=Vibrio genomosp. F10 TaxID=723171 RepID=UPI0002EA1A90|nr:hypothetical protein [Vibrio genomosp. F10]OEF06082.1 hypothetical protein A1QK_08615 [Vibrio genomosp. F10 str. 9ZD137]